MSTENGSRATGEKYAELLQAARAALYELAQETEVGAGPLLAAYDRIRNIQRAEGQRAEAATKAAAAQRLATLKASPPSPAPAPPVTKQRENWLAMSQDDRGRLALETLGGTAG